ncbi:MAG TPA: YihY/virulence factor BrkB family protein [Solirubrobacteraceae bacterium]|nr:YihY/virulence factor BrkB family protein [Solirubrobacteraceae bacterium]
MRTRRATGGPPALEPHPSAPDTEIPARSGGRGHHLRRHARATPGRLRRFWRLAWDSNITGLSAMVAYNMLLGIIPVALLGLFVAGHIVSNQTIAHSVVGDLRDIFPGSTQATLDSLLDQVSRSTTSTGVLALIASLWLASSFWGALDTSFSRIYGSPSRPWLAQKRFGVVMVGIVLLFMIATVAIPTLQSVLKAGATQLPLDLARVNDIVYVVSLAGSLAILFVCLASLYALVPTRRLRWGAIWPGALGATVAIGVVDVAFPVYLSSISTIAHFGTTVVFVVIVLGWFYVVALIILAGAVVNALAAGPVSAPPAS